MLMVGTSIVVMYNVVKVYLAAALKCLSVCLYVSMADIHEPACITSKLIAISTGSLLSTSLVSFYSSDTPFYTFFFKVSRKGNGRSLMINGPTASAATGHI